MSKEMSGAEMVIEALADQGFVHPDASYDRGLAYVMRYRAVAARPGDLGRLPGGDERDRRGDAARDVSPTDRRRSGATP